MNDQELDRAIRTAHDLMQVTAKGEQRESIRKHLATLIEVQRQRAMADYPVDLLQPDSGNASDLDS